MWTVALSPALCWQPAPRIRASAFTPHETSASCPSPRCPDTATASTAAASAPAVSTWPPAPPMPLPWCGQWTPGRSRPSWSIRAGVRWGCAPSLQTHLTWCLEGPMGLSHCGTLPPGPCAGTSAFHYWSRNLMSSYLSVYLSIYKNVEINKYQVRSRFTVLFIIIHIVSKQLGNN